MTRLTSAFVTALALLAAQLAAATDASPETGPVILSAEGVTLDQFLWLKRPVVVFADTPADPRFIEQMKYIERGLDDLVERDVVVITDTDPAAKSAVREKLRPRGFMLVLIAKDGTVNLRKPLPWTVRELSRSIDKMPMREEEIRRAHGE